MWEGGGYRVELTSSVLLNRFFTRNTFKQLLSEGENSAYSAVIRRYVLNSTSMTNGECISEIYHYLKTDYQNEYYYKNTLLNKLLLGIHNPRTTTALTEVPVGDSKADFILINGKAIVYEIKTALDNLDRLDGQIKDYYRAFSRVVVVTSEEKYDEISRKLYNSPVGICLLTSKGALSTRKEPVKYCDELSNSIMFKILRKKEYEHILLKLFGSLPNVSQFEYYRACKTLFESVPTDLVYDLFLQELKLRTKIDIAEYSSVPYELKFLVYFSNFSKSDYIKLNRFLCS